MDLFTLAFLVQSVPLGADFSMNFAGELCDASLRSSLRVECVEVESGEVDLSLPWSLALSASTQPRHASTTMWVHENWIREHRIVKEMF